MYDEIVLPHIGVKDEWPRCARCTPCFLFLAITVQPHVLSALQKVALSMSVLYSTASLVNINPVSL